ncbi:MFS transporter [Kribbella sp. NPDC004875]|uniref:MFS transporter n=1 Tax=Kribbella sp. NPDC004875 TaxID=3364107 RepID=UPI0036911410
MNRRLWIGLAALMCGTLLAPLNSSMIAVALTPIQRHYELTVAGASWLVTIFYLTAGVAQPVMGRIADAFGPRRVFACGMVAATIAAGFAPFAPSPLWLVLCRAVQAIGVSTSFPSALVILRRHGQGGRLSVVATVNTISGAVGPVLGGVLTTTFGWTSLFWINLPLTIGALVVALTVLGPDVRTVAPGFRATVSAIDPLGVLAFAATIVCLLDVMLGLPHLDVLPGLLGVLVAGTLFLWRERRARLPFVDVVALHRSPGLLSVLATFVLFNLAYYGAFYGLPLWFQNVRGLAARDAGLLIFPIAAFGALATMAGSRLMQLAGLGRTLIVSAMLLVAGLAGVMLFGPDTQIWQIVAVGIVLGVPYGLSNLGLQRLMYERTPEHLTGVVGGLFQSSRYLGAILAVGLVGSTAQSGIGALAAAMAAVAVVALLMTWRDTRVRRPPGATRPGAVVREVNSR